MKVHGNVQSKSADHLAKFLKGSSFKYTDQHLLETNGFEELQHQFIFLRLKKIYRLRIHKNKPYVCLNDEHVFY